MISQSGVRWQQFTNWIIVILMTLGIAINFNTLLFNLSSQLGGTPETGAFYLWHVWWPVFGALSSDTLAFGVAVNAYSGAPYLANHLGYMPLLQSVFFNVFQWLTKNPVLSLNSLLIITQLLTHYVLYAYLRSKQLSPVISALTATIVVLSGWYHTAVANGDIIQASLWVLPLTLLLWNRWLKQPTLLRYGLVIAVVYASVLSGIQNFTWLLNLWLPYGIWTLYQQLRNQNTVDDEASNLLRDRLIVMGFMLLILLLVYPMPNLIRTVTGNEAFFTSPAFSVSSRSIVVILLSTAPLVWLATLLALARFGDSSEQRLWLILGIANLVFALGLLPDVSRMLTGALGFTSQPLSDAQFMFGAAILALTIYSVQQLKFEQLIPAGWQRWLAIGVVSVLMLGALLPTWRGQQRHIVQNYTFLRELASDPEDYLVLHYPFGLTSLANDTASGQHPELARYALWHQKRTPNGIALYYDTLTFNRFSEQSFLFLNQLSVDNVETAAVQLGEAVRTWRIGYVIVHPELLAQSEIELLDSVRVESGALCPAFEQEGLRVYRARWHPAGC